MNPLATSTVIVDASSTQETIKIDCRHVWNYKTPKLSGCTICHAVTAERQCDLCGRVETRKL